MIKSVNCIYFNVDDLDHGISFYKSFKGFKLLWKTDCLAGLGLEEDITELILQTKPLSSNVCFECDDLFKTIEQIEMMGGTLIKEPFVCNDGLRAIIKDPFGNTFLIHDLNPEAKQEETKIDIINRLNSFILK